MADFSGKSIPIFLRLFITTSQSAMKECHTGDQDSMVWAGRQKLQNTNNK